MARTQIGRIICRCGGVKQNPGRSSPAARLNSKAASDPPAPSGVQASADKGPKINCFVQMVGAGCVVWYLYELFKAAGVMHLGFGFLNSSFQFRCLQRFCERKRRRPRRRRS